MPIRERWNESRPLRVAVLMAVVVLALWLLRWAIYPFTHSITNDAFIESHLVNVAPQVGGEIVEVFVQEQDRVRAGQLLARIDPATYRHQVELEAARLVAAEEGLRRAEADLLVLAGTVPKKVRIAELDVEVARRNQAGAEHAVQAAKANLQMAREDHDRFTALARDGSSTTRRKQEATREFRTAGAEVGIAEARLEAARRAVVEAETNLELARLGDLEIAAGKSLVAERAGAAEESRRALGLAEVRFAYTEVTAPFDAIVAKKWRHRGDYAGAGEPIFSVYDPGLLYVTANLQETVLEGVAPGNRARLDVAAYDAPFAGRVLWVGSATDAKFSLIPRDVSAGEFTYIVQRVPVRLAIEPDDRWSLLKPGLSVKVTIEHGAGDPQWAREALRRETKVAGVAEPVPLPEAAQ